MKQVVLLIVHALICFNLQAQNVLNSDPFKQEVIQRFDNYLALGHPEKLYLMTDKPYYSSGDKIWFKGWLVDGITHVPMYHSQYIYVELLNSKDSLVTRVKIKGDEWGFANSIPLDIELPQGTYTLRAYTQWMCNLGPDYFFSKTIRVANPFLDKRNEVISVKNDFDLQFFPEGGALCPHQEQIIAFKAIGSNGVSVGVEVEIYDSKENLLAKTISVHKGMGKFALTPANGVQYYAVATSESGVVKRVNLPVVAKSGCTVAVQQTHDRIFFTIHHTPDIDMNQLGVVIHIRGEVIVAESVTKDRLINFIPLASVPEGILHFSIIDKATKSMVSDRICFVKKGERSQIELLSNKAQYKQREEVELEIKVFDEHGIPIEGDFALSVTDGSCVEIDPLSQTVVSYLLMSSDIRGHIEDPAYYFSANSRQINNHLDLLMMTQGWTRFRLPDILKGSIAGNRYEYESSQYFTGNIKGLFGNPAREPSLMMINSSSRETTIFDLDNGEKFRIGGLNYQDSTVFLLQARGRNGSLVSLNLIMEPFSYPKYKGFVPVNTIVEEYIPKSFVVQSKEMHKEEGMRIYELPAATVTGERVEWKKLITQMPYNVFPVQTMYSNEIKKIGTPTMKELLYNFAVSNNKRLTIGDYYSGGSNADDSGNSTSYSSDSQIFNYYDAAISRFEDILIAPQLIPDTWLNRGFLPLFYVDKLEANYSFISSMNVRDISSISMIRGAASLLPFGPEGLVAGAVIVISLKDEKERMREIESSIAFAKIMELGWKKPDEFYAPKYEAGHHSDTTTNPDLRTTIYWNPSIKTDEYGTANVRFYTADKSTLYDVTLEGVGNRGVPAIQRSRIVVN
jgi:hypothetical protein